MRVYSPSRDMDKEKMADMSGHREIDRAGSNSEAFAILRSYSFEAVPSGTAGKYLALRLK